MQDDCGVIEVEKKSKKELIDEILKLKGSSAGLIKRLKRTSIKDLYFIFQEETIRQNKAIIFKWKCQQTYDELMKEVPSIERFFIGDITDQYGLRLLCNNSNGYKSLEELYSDVGITKGHMKSIRDDCRIVVILKATVVKIVLDETKKEGW